MEFIYIPFLLVIIILEPWNYDLINSFFDAKDCRTKFDIFKKIIITFFKDIILAIIFILLLVTLIDTIPTIFLIIRTIKRKHFPTEENKLTYNLHYKTEDFRIELRQIYNKNVKKITTTILFIFNILLITRIFVLFRRTWPFFIEFFKKGREFFIYYFCFKKKKVNKNDTLSKLPYIAIYEICSFLNPSEINNLSKANKNLNEKANINYIWEKVFYEKYDKELKKVLEADEYAKFTHQKYDSYKESCKNCYYIIKAKRGQIIEEIKNFSEIVEEETIKSIFNIPYLLLFPHIIFKFMIFILNFILFIIYKFIIKIFKLYQHCDQVSKPFEFQADNIILDNIALFIDTIYVIILICYNIFLIPHIFVNFILYILNFILFIINNLLFKVFNFSFKYNENLIEDVEDNYILENIKRIFIAIFQILIIFYNIFLIPNYFLNKLLDILIIILSIINDLLVNTFKFTQIYNKNLLEDKDNLILGNIIKIFFVIFQIIIICYYIFLIPHFFLNKILYILNLILFKADDLFVKTFNFS